MLALGDAGGDRLRPRRPTSAGARASTRARPPRTGWATVIGVVVALPLGATVLMATIAFAAQRYFESRRP